MTKKYEYIEVPWVIGKGTLIDLINRYGANRWRLAQIVSSATRTTIYFEREIINADELI